MTCLNWFYTDRIHFYKSSVSSLKRTRTKIPMTVFEHIRTHTHTHTHVRTQRRILPVYFIMWKKHFFKARCSFKNIFIIFLRILDSKKLLFQKETSLVKDGIKKLRKVVYRIESLRDLRSWSTVNTFVFAVLLASYPLTSRKSDPLKAHS